MKVRLAEIGVWACVLSAAFTLSIPLCPIYQPPGSDREIYRYFGMLIAEGGVPYLDAFDHRPPLIYFVAAVVDFMGPWGMWFITTLSIALAAAVFYSALRESEVSCPWIGPLSFILLMRTTYLAEGGGLAREISASLILVLLSLASLRKRLGLLTGFVIGLMFLTQPNDILFFAPIALLLILSRKSQTDIYRFIAGAALPVTGALLYVALSGAWSDFLYQAFQFNVEHYRVKIPLEKFMANFPVIMARTGLWQTLAPLSLAASCGFFYQLHSSGIRRSDRYWWLAALVCAFLIQCYAAVAAGRFYQYYLLTLVPFASVFLILAVHYLGLIISNKKTRVLAMCGVVFMATRCHLIDLKRQFQALTRKSSSARAYDAYASKCLSG